MDTRLRAHSSSLNVRVPSSAAHQRSPRRLVDLFAGLVTALVVALAFAGAAEAQLPTKLIVTVRANIDPAVSGGQVSYTIDTKNEGTTKASDLVVTIPIPAGTTFVLCTATKPGEGETIVPVPCNVADGVVTVPFGKLRAHLVARVNLRLQMPSVTQVTQVVVDASADSSDATDDRNQFTSTVLPPGSFFTFLPSGRVSALTCGTTLDAQAFGSDTTVQLSGNLGCTTELFALKITAADKILDLNNFKIFANQIPGQSLVAGSVGILLNGAARLKIRGGSTGTGGSSGIEHFDWCIKDEGGSKKFSIDTVRCFRARSVGFETVSKGVKITNNLLDRVIGATNGTAQPPGGVAIYTRGDNTTLENNIIRQPGTIGMRLTGTDADLSGRVVWLKGSSNALSRIENAMGVGLQLEGGPHDIDGKLFIRGDTSDGSSAITSTDGVVVDATGVDILLKDIEVKEFGRHGFVINGTGTVLETVRVEDVGVVLDEEGDELPRAGDGYVVAGAGTSITGSEVADARHGYVVTGADAVLDENIAEKVEGDGFVIQGDNVTATANESKENEGRGFVISGVGGLFELNTVEGNLGDNVVFTATATGYDVKTFESQGSEQRGIVVSGTGNTFTGNIAQANDGVEWQVTVAGNTDGGGNKSHGGRACSVAVVGTCN
jgi:uncharacterized repeat protein (TIGR01451 family)